MAGTHPLELHMRRTTSLLLPVIGCAAGARGAGAHAAEAMMLQRGAVQVLRADFAKTRDVGVREIVVKMFGNARCKLLPRRDLAKLAAQAVVGIRYDGHVCHLNGLMPMAFILRLRNAARALRTVLFGRGKTRGHLKPG